MHVYIDTYQAPDEQQQQFFLIFGEIIAVSTDLCANTILPLKVNSRSNLNLSGAKLSLEVYIKLLHTSLPLILPASPIS